MPHVLRESGKHTENQTNFFSGGILFPQEFLLNLTSKDYIMPPFRTVGQPMTEGPHSSCDKSQKSKTYLSEMGHDIGDVVEDNAGSVLSRRKRMVSAMLCTCA
jgi:hypothetical protein